MRAGKQHDVLADLLEHLETIIVLPCFSGCWMLFVMVVHVCVVCLFVALLALLSYFVALLALLPASCLRMHQNQQALI